MSDSADETKILSGWGRFEQKEAVLTNRVKT